MIPNPLTPYSLLPTMIYTGYLDFWFTDLPIVERVEKFFQLGIDRYDVWCWRMAPIEQIYAECKRLGARINSTFDEAMGSLASLRARQKDILTK